MIDYDVPLHLQALGSEDCGPVSSTMVLDYFGITSDQAEVIRKVPRCEWGTSSFDNASTLIDYGLKVEIVTANPKIFDGDFVRSKPTKSQVVARIKTARDKAEKAEGKQILEGLLAFIEKGGKLTIAVPQERHITKALDQGRLVCASTFSEAWGEYQGTYHFVVIGGYKPGELHVFNPWPESRKNSWEKTEEVIFGLHASTTFDYDNGALLLVGK